MCKESKPYSEYHNKTVIRKGIKKLVPKSRCKECDKICQQNYRKKNKDKLAKRDAEYYQKNKEYKRTVQREYIKNNRDKRNAYIRKYKKQRRLIDPNYKIYENSRKRIWKSLKNKSNSSRELIGCSINFYRMWLEFTFNNQMSWSNYGVIWHIDHVIPIDFFDLTKSDECKKAFNWINTRAMLIPENLKKKNKIDRNIIIDHNEQLLEFNKIVKFKHELEWIIRSQATLKKVEDSTTR
jgi:hypothetical protein